MRWRTPAPRVALWLLALLLLAGCGRSGQTLNPLAADATILAFGDSLTHGTGARPGQGYPEQLARLTGRTVINAGVPGETTAGGLERIDALLERSRPALVILCLGGNDMLRRLDRDTTIDNLREMARRIRVSGAELLLLGVPEPKLLSRSAATFYAALADELQAPLEERALAEILADRGLKSDPIHPNAAGYARLAEAVRERLVELGALDGS